MTDRRQHWDRVYLARESTELGWFEAEPTTSLRLLERAGLDAST